MKEFEDAWEGAYNARATFQELDDRATVIQKTWRGYQERKRLKKANEAFSKFQKKFRARRHLQDKKKVQNVAKAELQFQLDLEDLRKARRQKIEMLELLEFLPANKVEDYLEKHYNKQREDSARKIQANFRGYRARKELAKNREELRRTRAAVKIQRETRRWLEKNKQIRQSPAFYSRPEGLNEEKREFMLDKIRKHMDSLPVI